MSTRLLSATLALRPRRSTLALAHPCVCSRLPFSSTPAAYSVKSDKQASAEGSSSKSERARPSDDSKAREQAKAAKTAPPKPSSADVPSRFGLKSNKFPATSKKPRRGKPDPGSPKFKSSSTPRQGDSPERPRQASGSRPTRGRKRVEAKPGSRPSSSGASKSARESAAELRESQITDSEVQDAMAELERAEEALARLRHTSALAPQSPPESSTAASSSALSVPASTSALTPASASSSSPRHHAGLEAAGSEGAGPRVDSRHSTHLSEETMKARLELEQLRAQPPPQAEPEDVPEPEPMTYFRPAQGVPIGQSLTASPSANASSSAQVGIPYTRPAYTNPQNPFDVPIESQVYTEGKYALLKDDQLIAERFPSLLQQAEHRTRNYVVFLIDGDNCWFKPEFMQQGAAGAGKVITLLRDHLLAYPPFVGYDEHTTFRVVVFSNLKGLMPTLNNKGICDTGVFRSFISGINSLDPLNVFCDAGSQDQAADKKVIAHLNYFVKDQYCRQVYLGGVEDHGYRQEIAALKPMDLLKKVSLLSVPHDKSSASVEYYKAYTERMVQWASKVFYSSQTINRIKQQDANERASAVDKEKEPRVPSREAQRGMRFCTHHFLNPRGCLRDYCPYSHDDAAITEDDLADLKTHAELLRKDAR